MKAYLQSSSLIVSRRPSDSGNAILELALVLPVLCLFALGTLEFSRGLRAKQMVQAISREAAMRVFRECSLDTGAEAQDCLVPVQQSLSSSAQNIVPNADIVLSIYRKDSAGIVTREGIQGGSQTCGTRIGVPDFQASGSFGPAIQAHSVITAAEVCIPYQSVVGSIGQIFFFRPSSFYDITLY